MARTVEVRLDDGAEHDLELLRDEGQSSSAAIRLALREAAERRRSALRLEAEAASSDRRI